MQHESFSSADIASILNGSFIPIKLDRESRPDIDEIYMNYVTATTGSGGWPLNVFLTPSLDPVFGGTYWPSPESNSLPRMSSTSADEAPLNFLDVLKKMRDIWSTQQERCTLSAKDATQQLKDFAAEGMHGNSQTSTFEVDGDAPEPLDLEILDDALDHFMSRYDPLCGGFSPPTPTAPKFPTPPNLSFLLRVGAAIASTSTRFGFPAPVPPILGEETCAQAATMALHTLLSISRSGLRDQLGRGFHRYSVTADWNLPHFEKMLYDNAQLLGCFCDAFALSHDPQILGTIYSLVEYFTAPNSPIISSYGGFYSSEDADSESSKGTSHAESREGAFYVWTLKEFQNILGVRDANIIARHFGVSPDGNVPYEHDLHDEFLAQNILRIAVTPSILAKEFGMVESEIVKIIKAGRSKLAEWREKERPKPKVDNKIIAAWNGLAISALARATKTLAEIDERRSRNCLEAAEKAAKFIRSSMYDSTGKLERIFARQKDREVSEHVSEAFVDDYAYMTQAYLRLYDITFNDEYLQWANGLQEHLNMHFLAPSGGFYQTPSPSSASSSSPLQQIVRLKPGTDTALPSPNGIIAMNLLYLSSYMNEPAYVDLARKTIDVFAVEAIQHPFLFVSLLGAVVLEGIGVKNIIVAGDVDEKKVRDLNGWGRTIIRIGNGAESKWLVEKNATLQSLDLNGTGEGKVLICEAGRCRLLKDGELDRIDSGLEDEEQEK